MLVENVNTVVFDSLMKHQCLIVCDVFTTQNDIQPFGIEADRILSMYKDTVIVYNADKHFPCIRDNTEIWMYKISWVDNCNNIFGVLYPINSSQINVIMSEEIDNKYPYFNNEEIIAIKMALKVLFDSQVEPNDDPSQGQYFSSLSYIPDAIAQNVMSTNLPLQVATSSQPEENNINDLYVKHHLPMEEIIARFEPQNLNENSKIQLGFKADEQIADVLPPNHEIIAVNVKQEPFDLDQNNVVAINPEAVHIGGNTYHAVLKEIVTITTPENRATLPSQRRKK